MAHQKNRRKTIYIRQEGLCNICQCLMTLGGPKSKAPRQAYPHMTLHHILPKRHGGTNRTANLIGLCRSCHNQIEGTPRKSELSKSKGEIKRKKKFIINPEDLWKLFDCNAPDR